VRNESQPLGSGGLGKLPQWGPGQSPSCKQIFVHFKLENCIWWSGLRLFLCSVSWYRLMGRGLIATPSNLRSMVSAWFGATPTCSKAKYRSHMIRLLYSSWGHYGAEGMVCPYVALLLLLSLSANDRMQISDLIDNLLSVCHVRILEWHWVFYHNKTSVILAVNYL